MWPESLLILDYKTHSEHLHDRSWLAPAHLLTQTMLKSCFKRCLNLDLMGFITILTEFKRSRSQWQQRSFCSVVMTSLKPKFLKKISKYDMIIKTKQMIFDRISKVRAVKAQPYSGKGGREQQLICI